MRIDVIDTEADFYRARENWDAVFMADEDAQHFLSWIWLKAFLARRKRWFILALREREPGSPYVAFFPLRLLTTQDPDTGQFYDEILMAGNYIADYTGFITLPAYEEHAIAGFSAFIRAQHWAHFKLEYFSGTQQRRDAMVNALSCKDILYRDSTPKAVNDIDNTICPVISLPATFDDYLEHKMSSQTRQKLRRFLRRIEDDPLYRVTMATPQTIERDMDVLFHLWTVKWLARKGKDHIGKLIVSTREMLMDCFADGNLDVTVLWYGDQPLGALANIVDRQKKAILFYITGRDETWKTPSPGLVLHGYCIRRAIEDGFRTYDFLRGNEPYKYMFGVDERRVSCTLFHTRSGRNLGEKLNPLSIRYVYERGTESYRRGDKAKAESAFLQVLDVAPDHLGARFGMANLLFEKGELQAAADAYRHVALKASDPIPALVKLGDAQLALKTYADAARTFSRIVRQIPHHSQAHYKLGIALVADKQLIKARKAFARLQTYHSDDPAHTGYLDKATAAMSRISTKIELSMLANPSTLVQDIASGQPFSEGSPQLH